MSVEKAIAASFQTQKDEKCVYRIPPSFPAFEGHFENHPLLPAIAQIGLCVDAIGRILGKIQTMTAVSRAKFVRPIVPDTYLTVTCVARPDGQFACTLYTDKDEKCSQLILRTESIQ